MRIPRLTGICASLSLASSSWSGCYFFFSSRRRHTRLQGDWSSDVCSSDLELSFLHGVSCGGGEMNGWMGEPWPAASGRLPLQAQHGFADQRHAVVAEMHVRDRKSVV